MKQRSILLALVVFGSFVFTKGQNLSIDMGTASNYIAHGRTLSNDLPCFQPSASYGLKTGTTITAWFSLPYDRATSYNDEWDIIVDQSLTLFESNNTLKSNLHGYVNYWLNPRTSNPEVEPDIYNGMKYNIGLHKNIQLNETSELGMTFGYDFYYYQSFGLSRDVLRDAGIHEFLLKFNKSFKKVSFGTKSVISNNRGAINPNIIPGWAYFSQNLSVLVKTNKVYLRSTINYQLTLERTLHKDNLLWFTLNVSRGFKI